MQTILDECRTLWGEPEREDAGAECAWSSCMWSNVHGAVACACHQNVSLTELSYDTKNILVHFTALKQSGR